MEEGKGWALVSNRGGAYIHERDFTLFPEFVRQLCLRGQKPFSDAGRGDASQDRLAVHTLCPVSEPVPHAFTLPDEMGGCCHSFLLPMHPH